MFISLFMHQIKVVPNAYSGTFRLTRIHKIVNETFLRNLSVRIAVLVLPLRPFQFTILFRTKSNLGSFGLPINISPVMMLHQLL